MDEEIDLRIYIAVIIKRWYWIVGLTILFAILAYIATQFMTPVYQAEAKILILRATTSISFEPRIQSDDSSTEAINSRNSQETLVSLVTSSSVAEQVFEKLPDAASKDQLTILGLAKKIEASNTANLITIRASDADRELSAQLADIWATTYVDFINNLYGDRSITLLAEVESQVSEARLVYQDAQTNLEEALNRGQIATLQRDIGLLKQDLNSKYGTVDKEINQQNELLTQKYTQLKQIDGWLGEMNVIHDQLATGATSTSGALGDGLALMQLRHIVIDGALPIQLNLDVSDLNNEPLATIEDVKAAIAVVEAYQARVLGDIKTLSADLLTTQNQFIVSEEIGQDEFITSVAPVLTKIAELEVALEAEQAHKRERVAARDLAWENLQAVERKFAEVSLEAEITDSEVKLAASSVVPEHPVSPRTSFNVAIGMILGFLTAIVLVFVVEYWSDIVQLKDAKVAPSKQEART